MMCEEVVLVFWLCCVHVCGRRGAPQLQYIVAVVYACTVGGPQ